MPPPTLLGPHVLIPCGGKWVGHVVQVREAMNQVPAFHGGRVFVADLQPITPAGCFADDSFQVPPVADPGYAAAIRELALKHGIGLILPLIDIDVMALAPQREALAQHGIHVVSPAPDVAEICFDKRRFHSFATARGLAVPRLFPAEDLPSAPFPLFAKPARGFGSIGAGLCPDLASAEKCRRDRPDLIFEEYCVGTEYSVDLYASRSGEVTVAVVRRRDKVVGGEAYQTRTVRNPEVQALARACASALASLGYWGPLNVQIIAGPRGPAVIDVNPRLGSASLLSNVATSGRLFRSILYEAAGDTCHRPGDGPQGYDGPQHCGGPEDYVVGLCLTRFLGEVYHHEGQAVRVDPPPRGIPAQTPRRELQPHFDFHGIAATRPAEHPATQGDPI